MDEKVREAFCEIYEGEAKAALRLKLFANKADQEGLPQIARLFRVIAFSEEIHGSGHFGCSEKSRTPKAISKKVSGQKPVLRVWPTTTLSGWPRRSETRMRQTFSLIQKMSKTFTPIFIRSNGSPDGRAEATYYVCKVCGYISDGVWPDVCPVCSAPKDQFVEF